VWGADAQRAIPWGLAWQASMPQARVARDSQHQHSEAVMVSFFPNASCRHLYF
jgi:hypothetical protein